MTRDEKVKVLRPLGYFAAALIVVGAAMHLIGLITAFIHGNPFPWDGMPVSGPKKVLLWFIFLFAIIAYPASAVAIVKNIRWGYWITLIAPPVGGLLIFLGFFFPDSGLLLMLAGNFGTEITWMGFVQIASESAAVAYALPLVSYEVWRSSEAGGAGEGPAPCS
jgi:hypothetical protein